MTPSAIFSIGQLVRSNRFSGTKRITAVFTFQWATTVYHIEGYGDDGFEEQTLRAA